MLKKIIIFSLVLFLSYFSLAHAALIPEATIISEKLFPGDEISRRVNIKRDKTKKDARMYVGLRDTNTAQWITIARKEFIDIEKDLEDIYFNFKLSIPDDTGPGQFYNTFYIKEYSGGSKDVVQQTRVVLTIEVLGEKSGKCKDSDGGLDFFKKGSIRSGENPGDFEDTCIGAKMLFEYYCVEGSGEIRQSVETCTFGCKGGACLREEDKSAGDKSVKTVPTKNTIKKTAPPSGKSGTAGKVSIPPKKEMGSKKSLGGGLILIVLGFITLRYVNRVNNDVGGVGLIERRLGFVILSYGAVLLITYFTISFEWLALLLPVFIYTLAAAKKRRTG